MDDGLQNPSLIKDFSIAVIDAEARFGNGLCLPAGPLRAPLAAQAPYVDALVVIGSEAPRDPRMVAPGRPLFAGRLQVNAEAAAKLVGRSVLAFAGIARPEKFFASLEAIGARVAVRRIFPDHHRFSPSEMKKIVAEAERRDLIAVTTEKDRVRIPYNYAEGILTLPVSLGFDDARAVAKRLNEARAARRKGL